jgi:hypothetical protein
MNKANKSDESVADFKYSAYKLQYKLKCFAASYFRMLLSFHFLSKTKVTYVQNCNFPLFLCVPNLVSHSQWLEPEVCCRGLTQAPC